MRKSVDVAIIGGGIVGCALAYYLAKRIKGVVVIERRGVASEASGANYGMVWQQTRLPGLDLAMARRSLAMYEELTSEVFDIDIEYEKKGGMTVFFTPIQKKLMEQVVQGKRDIGIPIEVLDGRDARRLEPALSPEILGSTYCPDEAQLNPIPTTLAFARAARRHGAEILTDTAVHSIEVASGRVQGLTTNRGKIATSTVVNATGAWAAEVAKMIDLDVPIFPQRLQSMATCPMPPLVHRVLQGARMIHDEAEASPEKVLQVAVDLGSDTETLPQERLEDSIFPYIKPTKSDNIVLGTTTEFAGFDRRTHPDALALIGDATSSIVPALEHYTVIRSWANFVPFTMDSLPILGQVPAVRGFYMAAGHAHAFSHAPSTGEALAALIVDGQPTMSLEEASLSRFRSEKRTS